MSIECDQCGRCCANILLLSDYEIQTIKNYLKKHPMISVYNRNTILMKEDVNICPFLQEYNTGDKYCVIYPVRPSICRSYNCKEEYSKVMNYKGVKAINMLFTFGGDDQFSVKSPNLDDLNNRIRQLQQKIKKGEKKNG